MSRSVCPTVAITIEIAGRRTIENDHPPALNPFDLNVERFKSYGRRHGSIRRVKE